MIMEWSKSHAFSCVHICWGAFAGLYYHYGIQKRNLEKKMFGVFPHKFANPNHPMFKSFDDVFYVPHSRHSEVAAEDIIKCPKLTLLAYSDIAGVYAAADKTGRQIFITGHGEYDRDTLKKEYLRDKEKASPMWVCPITTSRTTTPTRPRRSYGVPPQALCIPTG
jgi:homoserine O-succinyltransferase